MLDDAVTEHEWVCNIYEAADRAGLLHQCIWTPADGSDIEQHPVGFSSQDESVLGGIALSTDYMITYPRVWFEKLSVNDHVQIRQGSNATQLFIVREIRKMGDGSEIKAYLSRLTS